MSVSLHRTETNGGVGGSGIGTPNLVSVVICAYNNWPDVELAIESALCQSYSPIEVIVVDNSSLDATPIEVPKRFGDRIRYLRQPNRGDSGAYNAGFGAARGEFIQFVDGDDVLAPNKIAKQVEVFRADPDLDIVYGDFRHFQSLAETAAWRDVATQPETDMLQAFIAPKKGWVGIVELGTLFHRKALERVGPWDEALYLADWDYWLRAAWAGCRFGHCPGVPMGFKRVRPNQMHRNASRMTLGREAVYGKALGYIAAEPYRTAVADELARTRFRIAIDLPELTRAETLAKLAEARATSRNAISAVAYGIGWAFRVVPGGASLIRSPRFRMVRRLLSRLFGFPMQWEF